MARFSAVISITARQDFFDLMVRHLLVAGVRNRHGKQRKWT
jgi:hypothetical protein